MTGPDASMYADAFMNNFYNQLFGALYFRFQGQYNMSFSIGYDIGRITWSGDTNLEWITRSEISQAIQWAGARVPGYLQWQMTGLTIMPTWSCPNDPTIPTYPGDTGEPYVIPTLDTAGLWKYPTFGLMITNLPSFLTNNGNILTALSYYTGLSTSQILDLMQPGKGPKVAVVDLPSQDGRTMFGQYDKTTKILSINKPLVMGLDVVNSQKRFDAMVMLMTITTLHEFVHYGRDVNKLSTLVNQGGTYAEAGYTFEMSIQPPGIDGTGINRNTAIEWIKYYEFNIN